MPIIEIDGKIVVSQSRAIARYVARELSKYNIQFAIYTTPTQRQRKQKKFIANQLH